MMPEDWTGEIYIGSMPPAGFRIRITSTDAGSEVRFGHYCGNAEGNEVHEVDCPNCGRTMFNVFDLDMADPAFSSLDLWNGRRLVVRVCPSCSLYFKRYWVVEMHGIRVVGGERDGGRILQDVRPPYPRRVIELLPLVADDYPTTPGRVHALQTRNHGDGIYHQIGGIPFRGGYPEMDCCVCGKPMRFCGIVDYDDLNVPLYEDDERRPVALIIGDYACLNVFTCRDCATVGAALVR